MEFFNKREDVIDLELTPHGEDLLRIGKFKPKYYAFFDDEILYDAKWAGINLETQNYIKDRIKEVPRLKAQYLFSNTELKNINEETKHLELESLPAGAQQKAAIAAFEAGQAGVMNYGPEHYISQYVLPINAALGNSSFESDKAPAWDIKLLYNNLTGSQVNYVASSSMHPHLKIPQLNVTIQYETQGRPGNYAPLTSVDNDGKAENLRLKEFDQLHEYPSNAYDNGYYDFQEDFVVLEINEHNVPYLKDNFDIEVYEVWTDDTEKYYEELQRKYFIEKPSVVNEKGLLKSQKEIIKSSEQDMRNQLLALDKTYVERYINVYVDHEIDESLMCKLSPNVKQKGYFVSDPVDCTKDKKEVNILSSDIYKKTTETIPECD